ncbi:putative receptor-like protein kinase At5g38990 [Bidens hawaiensis]|uniref:putative receptor-like protein kinase At5g38990 n=1 Tax=Bidens hawaiensis TaxID=980011 RepID=UPI00404A3B03
MMLTKYKHVNLISLLNFCFQGDERILVYEYASHGSLDRHLCNFGLKWTRHLKICIEVACALKYLHHPTIMKQRIIHRDIKSSNILLDENWTTKVSDFGLSKHGPANQPQTYIVSNAVGTLGYCDPLSVETGFLSKESDVYSFGVVLFEVLCGKLCCEYVNGELICVLVPKWKKCFDEKRLDDIIHPELKTQIDQGSLRTFSNIAYSCLNRDHKKRPTMSEIFDKLEVAFEQQRLGESYGEHAVINISRKREVPLFEDLQEDDYYALRKKRERKENETLWTYCGLARVIFVLLIFMFSALYKLSKRNTTIGNETSSNP